MNELNDISPMLAGIGNANVFTVPDGYFNSIAAVVLMCVKEEAGTAPESMPASSMEVPQGYFDSLAGNILNKIKAQESSNTEEEALPVVLQNLAHKETFTVPAGYFDSLADNILAKANDNSAAELKELSPLLHGISKQNVFTVPQGYFESFVTNVLNAAEQDNAATELRQLSPMLYSVQNENVFTVPQGYFASLADTILNKVQPQQAKVVSMGSRRIAAVLKYAVAAVFTGAMALGVYKFAGNKTTDGVQVADLPIPDYKKINQEIKDVDAELAKVSDDDIIKYLQVNGTDVDVAQVANTVDEKELPAQEDYLTDDKALDKYLDNIDLKDLKN
ncbi:hypothetical protein [Ferruginibacter sp.]